MIYSYSLWQSTEKNIIFPILKIKHRDWDKLNNLFDSRNQSWVEIGMIPNLLYHLLGFFVCVLFWIAVETTILCEKLHSIAIGCFSILIVSIHFLLTKLTKL